MLTILLASCKSEPEPEAVAPVAPRLEVAVPERAQCVPAGPLPVIGGAPGLSDVTANGQALTRGYGGHFEGEVAVPRGITLLEVRGTDATGHDLFDRRSILAGEFAAAEGTVPGAMDVRINEAGLAQIGDLLRDVLNPTELFTTLSASSPLYNFYLSSSIPFTDDTDVDFYLTALDFQPLEVLADATEDNLHLELTLPAVYIEIQTYGTITLLDDTDGDVLSIVADSVSLAADVSLDVAPNGSVTADLTGVSASLPGFDATWDYLWDVVDWIGDVFLDLEALIGDQIAGALEDLGEPLLAGVFEAMNTTFEVELLGKTLALDLRMVDIQADANGVRVSMDLGADLPETVESDVPGYLWLPPVDPTPDSFAPISMALSDNLVNRVLHEAWAGGMIELVMSTDDGSLDPLLLAPMGATSGTISVSSRLPPVVVDQGGELVAQLGEVDVRLETPGGENGEWIDLTMYAATALDLAIADNALTIGLGAPDVRFVVRGSDWGASEETITLLFEEQLPIDVLVLLLGNFSFPLPELGGITIGSATAARDPSGAHTSIALSLQ